MSSEIPISRNRPTRGPYHRQQNIFVCVYLQPIYLQMFRHKVVREVEHETSFLECTA